MTLSCGTLLAAPYLFDYDLVLLGVPMALVVRRGMRDGFRPWEKSVLAALWILPFIARIASAYHIPLTPILLALALASFAMPAVRFDIARSHG
jgi:alpha-1,2-mannosyltransferase